MGQKFFIAISFVLLGLLLVGCSGIKQADLDAAKAQAANFQTQLSAFTAAKAQVDQNKAFLTRYYDAVNKGNADALNEFFAPNYKRYVSATAAPLNADGQKQRLAAIRAAFPDLVLTIDNLIVEGDLAAVKMTARGTHQGTFQGIPATGKSFTNTAIEIIRIENGKLAEHWGGPDTLNLLQQIGAVISPGK